MFIIVGDDDGINLLIGHIGPQGGKTWRYEFMDGHSWKPGRFSCREIASHPADGGVKKYHKMVCTGAPPAAGGEGTKPVTQQA